MNFLHSGSLGDVIYSLPTIKSIVQLRCGKFNKANLYLRPDVGDTIPSWAGTRPPVRMSRAEAEKLIPLLQDQRGLAEVALFANQPIDVDLDKFRDTGFPLDRGSIGRYYAYAYKCKPCLYEPWLTVDPSPDFKGQVLVSRTSRYRNPRINYGFLAGRPNVLFVGYPTEYTAFVKECPLIPCVTARDARELAGWIAGAKAVIGNQSFVFALAEALKVPRLLEVYPGAANVVVQGPNGWDAVSGTLFKEIAEDLAK